MHEMYKYKIKIRENNDFALKNYILGKINNFHMLREIHFSFHFSSHTQFFFFSTLPICLQRLAVKMITSQAERSHLTTKKKYHNK